MTTLIDIVDAALTDAGEAFAKNALDPPVAVLWPDEAEQWGFVVDQLRSRRRLLTYGDYDPDLVRGPAYWIRCALAGTVAGGGPGEQLPVVYLPGVSRATLRDLSELDGDLAALAGIQFRSEWFSHANGKDWTIRALLQGENPGAGLTVAGDAETARALVAGLPLIATMDLELLRGRAIDTSFVHGRLAPDPPKLILRWIDDPEATRQSMSDVELQAFTERCKKDYKFDLAAGPITAARLLGLREGPWEAVWERFREAPRDYPNVPQQLRLAQPAELFVAEQGSWPAYAEAAEESLRAALAAVSTEAAESARAVVLQLEHEHGARRDHVWAELGWTPLVMALEHLARVAEGTSSNAPGASTEAIREWYAHHGWKVDRSVLGALEPVERKVDVDAVSAALDVIYRPWLEHHAVALQTAVGPAVNAGTYEATAPPDLAPGEIAVFVDGLRLDVAHMVSEWCADQGLEVEISTGLAALPTVTESAKPALAPIPAGAFAGGPDLCAGRADDHRAVDIAVLRKHLIDAGLQVLGAEDLGDPAGTAWTEAGEIDHLGHDRGVALAHDLDQQVRRVGLRVQALLDHGWTTIRLVTDHGWLLLPGALPKNEGLPAGATEKKKGRCARVKTGAVVHVPTVPWHWDPDVRIALAPGISCFEVNKTYEHGGVSPQECVVPRMEIRSGVNRDAGVRLASMRWVGLTLRAEFAGLTTGAKVQLRRVPADESTVFANSAKMTSEPGKVLLLVGDEDLEGVDGYLTVCGPDGALIWQREVTVGQNR